MSERIERSGFAGPRSAAEGQRGESVDVVINGQARAVQTGTTVAALIVELGLGERAVAVERNREVVPRASHASTELAAGDRVELVTFVGGG
jgi:thiamine biosynthesis protein ThiS